jgi:hypothetical protein
MKRAGTWRDKHTHELYIMNYFTQFLQRTHFNFSCSTETLLINKKNNKRTPWPWSASELYRPSDRRLSAKLVPTFAARGCRVVSATNPRGRIFGFLDRSRYYLFQAPPQLYSWGWVDPVSDPLLLRKSGSAGNQTRDLRICRQELWPLDHEAVTHLINQKIFLFCFLAKPEFFKISACRRLGK